MGVLVWKHGKSKDFAIAAVKAAIKESGFDDSVTWADGKAETQYGPFGSIVHVKGEVTEDLIVIEKCSGLVGGKVLNSCREMLERLFPGRTVSADREPAMIAFLCPKCQVTLDIPESSAGKASECPHCKTTIQVSQPVATSNIFEQAMQFASGVKDATLGAASSVGNSAAAVGEQAANVFGGLVGQVSSFFESKPKSAEEQLSEEQTLAFYGSLFAIAGADGDIEKDEVAAIFETLDTAKMSEAGRQKLYAFLFEPPLFDENLETLAQCPSELHYGLVVAMMEVALTDGELTDQEKGLLQRAPWEIRDRAGADGRD